MPVTVYLSGHLKNFTGGETESRIEDDPATVENALDSLWKSFPALRDRILNEQGEIREHVNIFAGGEDVKRKQGLTTAMRQVREIHIFNAVSGG